MSLRSRFFIARGGRWLTLSICLNLMFISLSAVYLVRRAQERASYAANTRNYRESRKTLFDRLPAPPDDIYIVGNSLVDNCEWAELLSDPRIKNRGIGRETVSMLSDRIGVLAASQPAEIVLFYSINDLRARADPQLVLDDYRRIVNIVKTESPGTLVTILAAIAPNRRLGCEGASAASVQEFNNSLRILSREWRARFIDVNVLLADEDGSLHERYTYDGIHLNGLGYEILGRALQGR